MTLSFMLICAVYPWCASCSATSTCSGHGVCTAAATCQCNTGKHKTDTDDFIENQTTIFQNIFRCKNWFIYLRVFPLLITVALLNNF